MKKNLYLLIMLLITSTAWGQYRPTSNGQVVEHTYYTLSYIEEAEQPEWVYYELTPDMVSGAASRSDNFREDPKIESRSAQLSDYRASGYDRGHLCPAASMSLNAESMSESFYMSNMSPQKPSFNRGGWKELEQLVRNWAAANSLLYVVTGPILSDDMEYIGENRVAVPNHYYKVLYSPRSHTMIAFVMPNATITEPLSSYAVSVDQVETLTNIDMFHELQDSVEMDLEADVDLASWDFGAEAPAPKAKTPQSEEAPGRCKGVTKSGSQCRNSTKNANGYCHLHQGQAI